MRANVLVIVLLTSVSAAFFSVQTFCFASDFQRASLSFEGKDVVYETLNAGTEKPLVLVLHGSSGPDVSFYRDQAHFFADKGFSTILLHYFDATKTSKPTTENYQTWARLVGAMVKHFAEDPKTQTSKVFLVGYSLGASVALAAGSQGVPVDGIAEWYGSLPDEFFYAMKAMPPLLILHGQQDSNIPVMNAQQLIKLCEMKHLECDSHIYPDQGHGFGGQALSDADVRTLDFFSKRASTE